jgi:aspartyl-tRNA(Asn)/glutamyl-tRNA(Gln) amidotransferase subunit C
MTLEHDDVRRIARLARIAVDDGEVEEYRAALSRILALVEQMNAVDTATVEPLAHPLERPLRLRSDEVTEGDRRDAMQAVAPATSDGLYLVPRVIE